MSDFSDNWELILGKVRPNQIFRLVEIVAGMRQPTRDLAAARYVEEARHFDETLEVAKSFGLVTSSPRFLQITEMAQTRFVRPLVGDKSLAFAILMTEGNGPFVDLLAKYLREFRPQLGGMILRPVGGRRLVHYAARDFLMSLGAVAHDPSTDIYSLLPGFEFLGFWAINRPELASQAKFDQLLDDRAQLGLRAELEVLQWEKHRVGGVDEMHVIHVSARNPAASYDIQSITREAATLPRFIEVKAVTLDGFEFHWSRAEIEAARLLSDRYFLYLLPVGDGGRFVLDKLQVISNPFDTIYQNSAEWQKEEASVTCRKRNPTGS